MCSTGGARALRAEPVFGATAPGAKVALAPHIGKAEAPLRACSFGAASPAPVPKPHAELVRETYQTRALNRKAKSTHLKTCLDVELALLDLAQPSKPNSLFEESHFG